MALPSLDELDEFVNVLFVGEGGSGKTTAASHLAMLGHVIAINCESGIKKRPLRKLGVPVGNIHPYTVTCYQDLDELHWKVKGMLDKDPNSVAGVTIDSVTELQKVLLESITGARHAKVTAQGMVDDEFETNRDEYGRMTEQMRRMTRRWRDLPCHVAFVCLPKREIDNTGAFYRPALTPAYAADIIGYVDIVVHTVVGDIDPTNPNDRSIYCGITRPAGQYRGKDRYGATPPVMANPTMDRIIQYVMDEDGSFEESDPFQQAYRDRMAAKLAASRPPEIDPVDLGEIEMPPPAEVPVTLAELAVGIGSTA